MADSINCKIEEIGVEERVPLSIHKPKPLTVMYIPGMGLCWRIRTINFSGIIPVDKIQSIVEIQDDDAVMIRYENERKINVRMRIEDILREIESYYEKST